MNSIVEQQHNHLENVVEWAYRLRKELGPNADRVHFRPSSKGVAMVGLLQDRPNVAGVVTQILKGLLETSRLTSRSIVKILIREDRLLKRDFNHFYWPMLIPTVRIWLL